MVIDKNVSAYCDVSVAIIVFNRPRQTKELLLALRRVRPSKLFVIADGPREGNADDLLLCAEVRSLIDNYIDWSCKVYKKYRDENFGCGLSPADGISWVFEHVEDAIILEDDCLPNESFFFFCKENLVRHALNSRVMMISGNNHLLGKKNISNSYFYSINTQTHGWATWKRAWSCYDFYMRDWPKRRSVIWLWNIHHDLKYAFKWRRMFDHVYKAANTSIKYDCWDFQWTYACWKNSALNIIPHRNLVSNNGYGLDATHITPLDHPLAHLKSEEINFPLIHPSLVSQDKAADRILSKIVYGNYSFIYKALRKIIRIYKNKFN